MAKRKVARGTKRPGRKKPPIPDTIQTDLAKSDPWTKVFVTLRIGKGPDESIRILCGPTLQREAMTWTYIARNRERWRGTESTQLPSRAVETLVHLGVKRELLATLLNKLVDCRVVEVSIPFHNESTAWEARVFPWEYVISAATESMLKGIELTVVRHLECTPFTDRDEGLGRHIKTALVVTSAPGELGNEFDFAYELELPKRKLGITVATTQNPTRQELQTQGHAWDLIHITGVDNHEASELLSELDPNSLQAAKWDGMVLPSADGRPEFVPSELLAKTVGLNGPALVIYNLYYSAARICPLTIARGANAAIGFQDTIEDTVAELFLSDFYSAWRAIAAESLSARDIPLAFVAALGLAREYGRPLRGSCIVLWSKDSIFSETDSQSDLLPRSRQLVKEVQRRRATLIAPQAGQSVEDILLVRAKPRDVINFASLHNRQPLFEEFKLIKQLEGQATDVRVEVELHTGAQTYPYRSTITAKDDVTDLAERVNIPLTWMRDGGYDEAVRSSLSVRVHWGAKPAKMDTFPVLLLPADEWEDNDRNRQWLPSFIYPRDPAVKQILQTAQPFLWCLADQSGAGFDGYQSFDGDAEDPGAGVDLQVRAIWSALIQELKLQYINPPPGYQQETQRLRTPSDVLAEQRGTCIDLTLLLAACCEYIDIHPVILLLQGHAFPGYWRSEEAHDEFIRISNVVPERIAEQATGAGQRYAWILEGAAGFREVKTQANAGNLLLLESTLIARGAGFAEAVQEGFENLRVANEFHSLVDVVLARRHGITPLPIRGART